MGKNMCLKCREKVIYKVYHNLQQHENLSCLPSIYIFIQKKTVYYNPQQNEKFHP